LISVRLNSTTEKHVDRVASLLGVSKSELIRQAIEKFISKYERPSPWELGEELFGKHGSGHTDSPAEYAPEKKRLKGMEVR